MDGAGEVIDFLIDRADLRRSQPGELRLPIADVDAADPFCLPKRHPGIGSSADQMLDLELLAAAASVSAQAARATSA
jgi:hypothetical protein